MDQSYPDFFRELRHCLDPAKGRTDNYASLKQRLQRVRKQTGPEAMLEQALLIRAEKIFANEQAYQDYQRHLRSAAKASHTRSQAEATETRRQLEKAHQQAQAAEAARQREVQKRQELEQQLAEERQRAAEAERQAQLLQEQEPPARNQGTGFWSSLLKVGAELGAAYLEKRSQANPPPESLAPAYRPAPINLTGEWLSTEGVPHSIWQGGNQIRIQARNPLGVVIVDSIGTCDGQTLRVSFQTAPVPTIWGPMATFGEAHCAVYDSGRTIRGQAVNRTTGQVFNVNLYRVS